MNGLKKIIICGFFCFLVILNVSSQAPPDYVEYEGFAKYVNKTVPSFVNVTVLEYNTSDNFMLCDAHYNDSVDSTTGKFKINITGDMRNMYRLRIYAYADASHSSVEHMSPSNIPDFPAFMYMQPMDPMKPSLFNQTITVVPATTLNFSAFKYVPSNYCGFGDYCIPDCAIEISSQEYNCSNVSFNYMVSDTKMGMEIASQWDSSVENAEVIVTPDRNYTIELMPNGPPMNVPIELDSSDAGTYKNYYINSTFDIQNITGTLLVQGDAPLLTSTTMDVKIIVFSRAPGNDFKMVPQDATVPQNIMVNPDPSPDIWDNFDNDTGEYILGLPGTGYGGQFLLTAWVNTSAGTYIGVQNITVFYEGPPMEMGNTQREVNISIYPTSVARADTQAHTSDFRLFDFSSGGGGGGDSLTSVTCAYNIIQIYGQNSSNEDQLIGVDDAHIELEVGYNISGEEYPIYWMINLNTDSQGRVKWSFPENAYYAKMKVFSQQYSPKSKTINMSAAIQNVTLQSFEMKDDKGGEMNMSDLGFTIAMMQQGLISTPSGDVNCDSLYPSNISACYIGDPFTGSFNPMQALMSGVANIRMYLSSGVQLRLMGVDLIASGPPDAAMDTDPSANSEGDAMVEAWKFGSLAPSDMYQYVFIGMPINTSRIDVSGQINVSIPILYNEYDNVVFNLSAGDDVSTVGNLTEYRDYLPDYENYFTDSGEECSQTNITAHCFINASDSPPMIWMRIPHFSTVEPTISGDTASTTPSSGVGGSSRSEDLYVEFDEVTVDEEYVIRVRRKSSNGAIVYKSEVDVYLDGDLVFTGVTDSSGEVEFYPEYAGTYVIEATKSGYNEGVSGLKIVSGDVSSQVVSTTTTLVTSTSLASMPPTLATTTTTATTVSTVGMVTSTFAKVTSTTLFENVDVTVGETCSDGVKNQNEEDVDCGGVCNPCEKNNPLKWIALLMVVVVLFIIGIAGLGGAAVMKKGKGDIGKKGSLGGL